MVNDTHTRRRRTAQLNSLSARALVGDGALSLTNIIPSVLAKQQYWMYLQVPDEHKVMNVSKFITGCVLCTEATVRYYCSETTYSRK